MNEPQNGTDAILFGPGGLMLDQTSGKQILVTFQQRAQGLFWAVIADKLFIIERQ